MPAFTFVATVNAVVAAGAVPVFAEIDDSLGIDPADLDAQITDRTAAIVAVHLENVACDLDAVLATAARHRVRVIEDAAQSFGATYHGRALGTFGALGAFSLQQEKNITSGEGGLVTTGDETLYLRAARFQDQGGQFVTSYAERARRRAHRAVRRREPPHGRARGRGRGRAARHACPASSRRSPRASGASSARSATSTAWPGGAGPTPTATDRRASPGSCPTRPRAKRFAAALRAEGIPSAQMYRGRPVYLNAAVLARRTASGKGGPWACAEHPTVAPTARACARVPRRWSRGRSSSRSASATTSAACDDVASAVRKVAAAVLQ